MLNIVIADNNMYYVKKLVNFVIGKNPNIKITNIVSNGFELLNLINQKQKIDLIILDLNIPKLNGLQTLDILYNMNLNKYPDIIVLSSENNLINKAVNHPLVTYFINKNTDMINIYYKIRDFEKRKNVFYMSNDLSKKILSELVYIGYNPSHIGTQYIKECIFEIYESKDLNLIHNLENCLYNKIACTHNKSFQNVKTNIMKATNYMYLESNIDLLKDYFHFNDSKRKPTPKMVISTILNKI